MAFLLGWSGPPSNYTYTLQVLEIKRPQHLLVTGQVLWPGIDSDPVHRGTQVPPDDANHISLNPLSDKHDGSFLESHGRRPLGAP